MEGKIPIMMCIDVEPDGFFIDRTKPLPWKGYEGAYHYFSELRPRLEALTDSPVHFNWFYRLDPQVAETYGSPEWPITNYPKLVEDFLKAGDEISLHSHAYRWEKKINNWIEDLGNQKWVNYCVEMGFETYKRLFNRICESFRFGAYWISAETINFAEGLGAKFDLTVEPGFRMSKRFFPGELYSAPLPNYDHVPQEPYRPSRTDFSRPDPSRKEGIWIIPMSTGSVVYKFGNLETLYKKLFAPKELGSRPVTLNLARGINGFRSVMENLLASLNRPYFAMVVRSDVCGEFNSDPTDQENMRKNVEYIMSHPLGKRFIFSTPREAMSIMGYLNGKQTENGNS
ncbi:MAG: hypothetical protein HY584_00910 [Candidatus Omnitrophica bacterium]|nr:hypothetical protein [Candidatus Omnitrophota bacterium]